MNSKCGCKIGYKINESSGIKDVILFCPRHSPERVKRLEEALQTIVRDNSDSMLVGIAQEALRLKSSMDDTLPYDPLGDYGYSKD